MANQIAQFFAAEPDRKAAVDGVAGHLQRFWEPRMRRAIFAALDAGGAGDLHELARTALTERRAQLEPAAR
jgi:formate dehydrogenase subunit delta